MLEKRRIGIIGAGNLGGALAAGLLRSELADRETLCLADASEERLAQLAAELGGPRTTTDNRTAVESSDVVVLSVKPYVVAPVLEEVADLLQDGRRLVISLAAAVPISRIEDAIPGPCAVVRAMPNIAMTVQASATGVCANSEASEEDVEVALAIFRSVGVAERVDEGQMHAVTALSGSGPAYVFTLLEGLAAGGVKMGLPAPAAYRLAAQTLLGGARLALESGIHPGALRDQVTTPGGTTIAGLHEIESAGVRAALMSAVESAAERSIELAELLGD